MVFHNNAAYYEYFLKVNVVMLSVSPMDRHGYFNYSVNTGVAAPIVRAADIVIVEINENLPKVRGGYDECIHISDIDYIVEGEHEPYPDMLMPEPTAVDRKILISWMEQPCRSVLEVCRMHWVISLRSLI